MYTPGHTAMHTQTQADIKKIFIIIIIFAVVAENNQ